MLQAENSEDPQTGINGITQIRRGPTDKGPRIGGSVQWGGEETGANQVCVHAQP